jgi:hypothetical protein
VPPARFANLRCRVFSAGATELEPALYPPFAYDIDGKLGIHSRAELGLSGSSRLARGIVA